MVRLFEGCSTPVEMKARVRPEDASSNVSAGRSASKTDQSSTWRRLSWHGLVESLRRPKRSRVVAIGPVDTLAPPPSRWAKALRAKSSRRIKRLQRNRTEVSFFEAFGLLGPPLLFVVTLSAAWTLWLMAVNLDPNGAANFLMGTGDFDNGAFWLLLDADPVLLVFVLTGLGVILLGFGFAVLKMTLWRNRPMTINFRFLCTKSKPKGARLTRQETATRQALDAWGSLTGFQGTHRKLWVRLDSKSGLASHIRLIRVLVRI